MAALLLGPLLRYVNDTSATVWVETDQPCTVRVLDAEQHTFTVAGHHYALVVITGLEPGTVTPYAVHLTADTGVEAAGTADTAVDRGRQVWPLPGSTLPPSVIRTLSHDDRTARVVFGSCRATAGHEPPYVLRPDEHAEGKGVDSLRAMGLRMLHQPMDQWPDIVVFLGDQVYADESSPSTARRIERRRTSPDAPPAGVVADFEEYTWLYHEAWSPEIERWLLSTVPSTMIFDDHDMIDDWNISQSWVADIRTKPWWSEHVIGGLVTYWIYQHLGNLAPARIDEEGVLARVVAAGDATQMLREWAFESERFTPVPGGYQFSFDRHLPGDTHLVVIDSRNGRVLEPGGRKLVDDDEWAWVRDRALEPATHVLIATSLPAFVPGGIHGVQQWNEAVCDGNHLRWLRRPSEWLRRAVDMEDWAAFDRSFRALEQLLIDIAGASDGHRPAASVHVLSGDIHFGYVADITLPDAGPGSTSSTVVRQVVCSPIRNLLRAREARIMAFGAGRIGRKIGGMLQRWSGRGPSATSWEISAGPVFDNHIGTLDVDGNQTELTIERAVLTGDGRQVLEVALTVGTSDATSPNRGRHRWKRR